MTEETATGSASPPVKRTYGRRAPLCRLCLLEHPKDELQEIFCRGSDWKKRIFRATGIKPHRNDPITRLCRTCWMMVDLVVDFQEICQQTDQLMRKSEKQPIVVVGNRWTKEASGLINSLWSVMTDHREAVMTVESDDNEPATTVVIEQEEVFEVEYLAEAKEGEEEEQKLEEVQEVDIKEEEEEDEAEEEAEEDEVQEDEKDGDYQCEEDLEEDAQESDQEDSEEEVKPKRKRGRNKPNGSGKKGKYEKVMCDTCGVLVSQVCLEGHLNRHLGVKPFVCEIEGCGRRLHSKYSLQQHRHLHKSIMRYYDCPDCGKRIKGTNCWMRHRKLHTEDPKHACDVCGKKFRRKYGLQLHSVVHTGVALFPCEICGKRFTVKHNLGAHYRTHKRNGTYPAEGPPKHDQEQIDEEEHLEHYQSTEQNSVRYDSFGQ